MCDYSLMSIPNRLAVKGEELVAHRFRTGSMGFASPSDLQRRAVPPEALSNGLWSFLRRRPETEPIPAVCIPPGAGLMLQNIPERLQRQLAVGPVEEVTFVQLSYSAYTYRDAVRFKNRREVRLQELIEGQRVLVLDLSMSEPHEPFTEQILVPVVIEARDAYHHSGQWPPRGRQANRTEGGSGAVGQRTSRLL